MTQKLKKIMKKKLNYIQIQTDKYYKKLDKLHKYINHM